LIEVLFLKIYYKYRKTAAFTITIFFIISIFTVVPQPVKAWDSLWDTDGTSHHDITQHALADVMADPNVPSQIKDSLTPEIRELLIECSMGMGEEIHGQVKENDVSGYRYYSAQAVGNNPGTTHPEYWWQTAVAYYRDWQRTGNLAARELAYQYLARVIHSVEDQGSPPHAWYSPHGTHGESLFGANFELVSFLTQWDTEYYKHPGDGKNVVNADDHDDNDFYEFNLNPETPNYISTGLLTYVQTPAPTHIKIDFSISELWGNPEGVRFLVHYVDYYGNPKTIEGGPFSLDGFSRESINIYDLIQPNSALTIDYKRAEEGSTRTGQIAVYVVSTVDIAFDAQRPSLTHPWQYYYWLKSVTQWNTAAPYWRAYWTLGGFGPLSYGINWDLSKRTECALLSLQWAQTELALKWFIEEAQQKLNDPNYSVNQAAGTGTSITLFQDINYNSGSSPNGPEFLKAQTITYDPTSDFGNAYLDPNFQIKWDGPFTTIESANLGFMSHTLSSIEIRNAKVFLYDQLNFQGDPRMFKEDIAWLGDPKLDFNDRTQSMRIELAHPPAIDIGENGIVNEGSTFTRDLSFYDPLSSAWDIEVNYGDGQSNSWSFNKESIPAQISHAYVDNGMYSLSVKITDDDGWNSVDYAGVTVLNVAPVITKLEPTLDTNLLALNGIFTDPGTLDTHTLTVSWGDSKSSQLALDSNVLSFSTEHTYDSPGTFAISVTVTDKDGGKNSQNTEVHISAQDMNQAILDSISNLQASTINKKDTHALEQMKSYLDNALDPTFWSDKDSLQSNKGVKVFNSIKDAVNTIDIALQDKGSTLPKTTLDTLTLWLTNSARYLAINAIDISTNNLRLTFANQQIADGDSDADQARFVTAIEHYKVAWQQATT
jgi:hypothetical protein